MRDRVTRSREPIDPSTVDLGGPGLVAALRREFKIPSTPALGVPLEPDERGVFVLIRDFKGPADGELPELMKFVRGESLENRRMP